VRPPPPEAVGDMRVRAASPLPFGWGCGRPIFAETTKVSTGSAVSIAFRLGVRPPPSSPRRTDGSLHAVSIAFRLGVRPPQNKQEGRAAGAACVSIAFRLGVRPPLPGAAPTPPQSSKSPLPFGWGCGRPDYSTNST